MAEIQKNAATQEELGYKEAYLFLFSGLSDIIEKQMTLTKEMIIVQKQCEEICISGLPNGHIDNEKILAFLDDMIKQNL